MNETAINSFDEIFKNIKPVSTCDFSSDLYTIYQCFYELLNKIDFQNMNVCIFCDMDGFFIITINQRAKLINVFPCGDPSALCINFQRYKNEHKIKKFNLFDYKITKMKTNIYSEICYIKSNESTILSDCAFLIISFDNEQFTPKLIKDNILPEGILIVFSLKGKSDKIVEQIKKDTFFNSVQKYTICPSNSIMIDITILNNQKNKLPYQLSNEIEIVVKELPILKIVKINQTKSKYTKSKKAIVIDYFLCIFSEKNNFQTLTKFDAHSYIFLPLFEFPDLGETNSKKVKSITINHKKSVLNKLTPAYYNEEMEEINENNDSFDFDWKYKIESCDNDLFKKMSDRCNDFINESASISSFTDLIFEAHLFTLPDYKTLKDPLNIKADVKINSDGIFIYSSSPFYHVVFADFWDMNSFATPFPYIKYPDEFKDYRQKVVFVFTKESRKFAKKDESSSSDEIEIQRELDFLFPCEVSNNQPTNDENNNDNDNDDEENVIQDESEVDKEDKQQNEKDKSKIKDKTKNKKKDKTKGKDKNKDLKGNTNKNEKEKDDLQSKTKNEKNDKPENNNSIKKKVNKLRPEKQETFFDKTLGCISLKFANSQTMMDFVIKTNQAISYSMSSSIKRNVEKMVEKLNIEKLEETK